MKVIVAVDPDYGTREHADLGDAFWLVESAPNRAMAEKAWAGGATDPNSAIFQRHRDSLPEDEALERFADADLHHPAWTEMAFYGVALSPSLKWHFTTLSLSVTWRDGGFVLRRMEREFSADNWAVFAHQIGHYQSLLNDPLELAVALRGLIPEERAPASIFNAVSSIYEIEDQAERDGAFVPANMWHSAVREARIARRKELVVWATPLLSTSLNDILVWSDDVNKEAMVRTALPNDQ
jgi:hypothetical protein